VFSASQAAEAMSYFALAGFDTQKILDAIGPALDLAAAGQLEIAEAADITAKIMAGMGIEARDVGKAVDIMAKAMTTANTDLRQLGDAMKFVGPIAKTAGIGLEELTAAIQLLSNAGVQGEMAGTTIRGMLLALTSPSAEAGAELGRLGVRIKDEQGNVRMLADIIEDLQRGLSGMGSGERLASLGQIFDARQAAGAAELVAQGAERLREFTSALQDAGGTASRLAATQIDNLAGETTILKSTLEGLAIAIGEAVAPKARALINLAQRIVAGATAWASANQRLIRRVAELAVGIGAVGVTLLAVSGTAFVVGKSIATLSTLMVALGMAVKGVTVALTFLAAHPVAFIVLGIVAAYSALYYAIRKADDATKQLNHTMSEQARRGEELRSADMERMRRLEELAAKEKLNTHEMREAHDLIGELESRYGDLGISLDETTGRIDGMAGAWDRLTGKMREAALFEVGNALRQERQNLDKLATQLEELRATTQKWGKFVGGDQADFDALADQIAKQGAKVHKLQLQRDALQAGSTSALTGGSATPDPGAGGDPMAERQRQIGKLELDWADKLHQLKLQQIDDEFMRAYELIDLKYKKERDAAKAAGANLDTLLMIEEARRVELAAAVKREDARVAEAKKRHLEEQAMLQQRIDEQRYQVDRLSLQTQYRGIELQKKLLDLERARALAAAKAEGLRTDLVEKEFRLREQLMHMEVAMRLSASEVSISRGAIGGGDAEATLQGGIAGVDREEVFQRIFDAVRGIGVAVARIDRKTQDGGLAYG
jgi:TP901 family phage tail tape measure protein